MITQYFVVPGFPTSGQCQVPGADPGQETHVQHAGTVDLTNIILYDGYIKPSLQYCTNSLLN